MHKITRKSEEVVDIELTRGDSLFLEFKLTKDGEPYTPEAGSSCRFAMKKAYTDADVILEKNIPIESMILSLAPADTKTQQMKATFVYDVQLTDSSGNVETFVKGKFKLTEEVD